MTAVDPEGRIRHQLDVFHSTLDAAGGFVAAGMVPVADGLGQVEYVDSATIGGGLPWYNVENYGAVHDGSTDDTVAIQAAIDACMTVGGGTVFFPPGIYQISGALQNTGTHNSQLVVPTVAGTTPKAIRFLGMGPIRTYGGATHAGESVIRSDWNGTISGNPAIFSTGTYRTIRESFVYVTFQDLVIEAHDDPKLSALQMTAGWGVRIVDVQIRTTSADPSSVPTHSNAVGYDGVWGLGSTVPDYATGLDIYGFYTGLVPAEQFHGVDVGIAYCARAILFVGGQGAPTHTHYPVYIDKLVVTLCPRVLVFTSDIRWVNINMAIEHDNAPWAVVYDIDDASNFAYGFIDYHALAFSGTMGDILVNGGSNLSLHWGHGKYWKLNSVVEIPTGTDPSTNPATGGKFYAASATGHPSWRDSAGTVTDLLSGGSPTGAAGGDLSGTYPNPSVVKLNGIAVTGTPSVGQVPTATSSSAATWQTPSTSSGGIGPILISDTPAGSPLVFADLLQNDDGTDLLYADT